MKKLMIVFTLFTLIFGISVQFVDAMTDTDVSVTLTVLFDENNEVPISLDNKPYGHVLSMDEHFDYEDYDFVYWVVNGVVMYDYEIDHAFVLTHDLILQAVFSPDDKHAVLFMDSNGLLLETQYVLNGEDASEYSGTLPSKPGHVIADPMWSSSLTSISTDTVLVLQYQKDDYTEYTISVLNGTGSGVYTYNDVVTIKADAPSEGLYFTHWEMDGEVVSYEKNYRFTVMEDMGFEAHYASEPIMKLPLVTISNALELRTGYDSYRGQFYVPNGYELIEFGMIASTEPMDDDIKLGDENVQKMQGFSHTISSNEWLFSFNQSIYHTVRGYLVVRNSQDEFITLYSNAFTIEESTYYFTGFEDVSSVTNYNRGTITTNGYEWDTREVRISTDSNFTGWKGFGNIAAAIRYSDGYLQSNFTVSQLDEIEFWFARYGTDTNSSLSIEISLDKDNWITVMPSTSGPNELTQINLVIDYDDSQIINAGITRESEVYVRFSSNGSGRTMLDNISLHQKHEGYSNDYTHYLLNATSNINTSFSVSEVGPWYEEDTEVTITAGTIEGYDFVHWTNALTGDVLSTNKSYMVTMSNHTHLYAYYEAETPLENEYDVILDANIEGTNLDFSPKHGIVHGTEVSVITSSVEGYRFEYWWDEDYQRVASINQTYSFEITRDRILTAIYLADDEYGIYLSSNIDQAVVSKLDDGPFALNDTVDITTSAPSEYNFVHWYDYYNDIIVSTNETTTVDVIGSRHIVAVYQYTEEPSTYYSTGFEFDSKGSYTGAFVEIDNRLWWFEEALTGSLDNDKLNDTQSVRLRGTGYIETYFTTPFLYELSFEHAYYGNESGSDFKLFVSSNQIDWIHVDTVTNGFDLNTFTYTFDDSFYDFYDLKLEDGLYIRIQLDASSSNRGNIDDVVITQREVITPTLPQDLLESEIAIPNNSTRLNLSLTDIEYYYSLGDLWEGATCSVTDTITNEEVDCLIAGEVDTTSRGKHTVTYYAIDEDGFYASQTLTKIVFTDATLLDYEYSAYYEGIKGLYGEDLILALRDILWDGLNLQEYGEARYILQESDVDPNNPENVIQIYTGDTVKADWDTYREWDREHIWPNSRLGVGTPSNTTINIATDLHNLRPIDTGINSSRGNLPFNYEGEPNSWYPGPDRGDVARVYFYMMTMWSYLVLTDDLVSLGDTYTVEGAVHGYLSALIFFHYDDPVDAFEIHRNDVIYSYQNNRNPFIDYPHLIELIYFDHPNIPED